MSDDDKATATLLWSIHEQLAKGGGPTLEEILTGVLSPFFKKVG